VTSRTSLTCAFAASRRRHAGQSAASGVPIWNAYSSRMASTGEATSAEAALWPLAAAGVATPLADGGESRQMTSSSASPVGFALCGGGAQSEYNSGRCVTVLQT